MDIQRTSLWLRHAGAFLFAILGCAGVFLIMLVMNQRDLKKPKSKAFSKMSFVFRPPKRKPPVRRKVQRKKRRARRVSRASRAPRPQLASSLSGLDFGLPSFGSTGLDQASDRLLGQSKNLDSLVMTERSVDKPPAAMHRVVPKYPSRARTQGVTGQVSMRLLIGTQGQVLEVQVLSSRPRGVFDRVAMDAIRQWRFQPALYKGQPVKVRANQTLKFQLN